MTSTTVVAHGGALDDWLARRRALGQDVHDEVWDGIYHVTPHAPAEHARLAMRLLLGLQADADARGLEGLGEFNLGSEHDYRVPDFAWVERGVELPLFVPTAVICGEVVSPGDASLDKVPFYLAHGVQEVWLVEPDAERLSIIASSGASAVDSAMLGHSIEQVRALLGWG